MRLLGGGGRARVRSRTWRLSLRAVAGVSGGSRALAEAAAGSRALAGCDWGYGTGVKVCSNRWLAALSGAVSRL